MVILSGRAGLFMASGKLLNNHGLGTRMGGTVKIEPESFSAVTTSQYSGMIITREPRQATTKNMLRAISRVRRCECNDTAACGIATLEACWLWLLISPALPTRNR